VRLIRARIIVEGRVQKVGYRDLVQSVARKLGVKGYVENLKEGNVQIVCEAEETVLEEFAKAIDFKEDLIEVEKVQIVEESEATGEFGYFEIRYGRLEEEFGDRMGTAIEYARAMRGDIQSMRGDIHSMHEDVRDMHSDIRDMRGELKEGFAGISSEIKDMRGELREGLAGIHSEIKDMRGELREGFAGVSGEVRDMHVDMNKSFEEMAKRYDSISSELIRSREELTRAVSGLLKLIEEFIQERRAAQGVREE